MKSANSENLKFEVGRRCEGLVVHSLVAPIFEGV
jgi:hypothetical protein